MLLSAVVGVGLGFMLPPAWAQAPAAASPEGPGVRLSDDGTRVIYGPEFFGQFNAVTAVDILKRIPGIQDLLNFDTGFVPGGSFNAVEKRGFGSTGEQILINGERISGKTNDTGGTLQRIQARQVERVEVIRGAVAGLDVRSEGLIVNVVLKGSVGSGTWEASATNYTGGRVDWGGRLSYAATLGALNYNVSVQEAPRFLQRDRVEFYFNPITAAPFQRNTELNQMVTDEHILSSSASYAFSNGDKFSLNGRYDDKSDFERQPAYQFGIPSPPLGFLRLDNRERQTAEKTWEIGGDYTHDFTGGGQFKSLFVYTDGSFNRLSPFKLTPAGLPEQITQLQKEDRSNSEKILRGSYRWPWSPTVTAELGGETAINTLNEDVRTSIDSGSGLRPIRLFNGLSQVQETRIEPFSSLNWQVTSKLFVDARLEFEYSRLKQSGPDVNQTRSLFYPRPGIDIRYDLAPLNQLRASIQRTVGQLNFADFVASFANDDARAGLVNAGNPNLVPQRAWEYALTYERRLGKDGGVVSLKAFYNDISDLLGVIPVGPLRDLSAVGNTGAGRAYGLESKASVRLSGLGLPGVVLNATGLVRHSRSTDSFTGRPRPFQDYPKYAYSFGFRHDTQWRDLSYGVSFDDEALRYSSDINYTQALNRKFDGNAFVEMRALPGIKAKFEVKRMLHSGAERNREVFIGNRAFTPLLRRDNRVAIFDRTYALTLSGSF